MRIMVAGATGALGSRLVPMLAERGHEVIGTTTRDGRRGDVAELGARPLVMNGLDPIAVGRAVSEAEPEVIVNQMTALAGDLDLRRIDRTFAMTNRLRTEGTDNLLSAARAAGARRFVAQSFTSWPYAKTGGPVKAEDAPLDPDPPPRVREMLAAIRHLEAAVSGDRSLEGVVLRYGGFYGPGTSIQTDPDGAQVEAVRKRQMPIVGSGAGVFSFIHIDDAARATVAAIEAGPESTGLFNVVDDDPAPVREWLPALATAIGAKPPRRVPRWLGRLFAGAAGVSMMTEMRGASNAKARRELGWEPRYPSWRQGFAAGLSPATAAGRTRSAA